MVSVNNAKISLAGLILMTYIERIRLYRQGSSQILFFFKTLGENYEAFSTNPTENMKGYLSKVTDPVAKEIIGKLVDALELKSPEQTPPYVIDIIHSIFEIIHKTLISTKQTGPGQKPDGLLSKPGDIIHFLKILFMSLPDPELLREMRIYVNALHISTSQTATNIRNEMRRQGLDSTKFISKLGPFNRKTGESGTTIDFDKKKDIAKNILRKVPTE